MRPAALLLCLLLVACSDVIGPGELPLDFDRITPPEGTTVEGGVRQIVIIGAYETRDCHAYEVERATLQGDVVALRLEFTDDNGDCAATPRVRGYRARIRGVEAGAYTVRIEYEGDVAGPALDREVVVRSG